MPAAIETTETWIGRLPSRSSETAPFWDACNRNVFLVQRCRACRQTQYHYRAICAHCWSGDLEDIEACGRGKIWTFTVVHRNRSPVFAAKVPYAVVLVALEEGVSVFGNMVDCEDLDEVAIGRDVTLAFVVAEDGQHIPVFRLAEATS